jgi:transcriptional regulator with XRE-family HTH domain
LLFVSCYFYAIVNPIVSISARFRDARERLGLSPTEAASRLGISVPCLWDIESGDDELSTCYSPTEVRQFCEVLGVRPAELFSIEATGTPVSAEDLARLVHAHCQSRGIPLSQFEDAVGWRLADSLGEPQRLLQALSIDGLRELCRELGVDWQKVILSL